MGDAISWSFFEVVDMVDEEKSGTHREYIIKILVIR